MPWFCLSEYQINWKGTPSGPVGEGDLGAVDPTVHLLTSCRCDLMGIINQAIISASENATKGSKRETELIEESETAI